MSETELEVDSETVEEGESLSISIRTGDDPPRLRDSRPYIVYRFEDGEWKPAHNTAGGLMQIVELDPNEEYEYEWEAMTDPGPHRVELNALETTLEVEFQVVEAEHGGA